MDDLAKKVQELEAKLRILEQQQIKIVGEFDGTDVQVTVNGIRRSITTSAP